MYDYIKGVLTAIHPTAIIVEAGGIGYAVSVSNPYSFSSQLEQSVMIYTYQAVREDAITLYGFPTYDEKQLFLKLISVSGIGPKSALSILASQDAQGLMQAIENNDVTYLTKFPGVGKKTAGQLVLDLKGKLSTVGVSETVEEEIISETPVLDDVTQALLGLGYSNKEIRLIMPTLKEQQHDSTQSALSAAFKLLLGKK
ncbi:Holliday junction branch migration protein RuvA [Carnobacteriaceae bacterium zg-ZUI252]|nr:Holliday junction branch migration protein RuvA [Carnobacteriaceae bacterium zg-ZUI252]MBS4770625.1 Holliday junction branch migration protein RuvA [Carnobacteriaceae bacterium zg-ZUI240]